MSITGTTDKTVRTTFRRLETAPVALVLPCVVYIAQVLRYRSWLVDDAFISFAYARTLSESGRFAEQVGAPLVEGASNLSWTLLLAGLRVLGVFDRGGEVLGVADYIVTIRVLGVVLFVGTLLAARSALFALPISTPAAQLGSISFGLLLAFSPSYVIWSNSGLENPLYGFLVALLVAVLCRGCARNELLRPRVCAGCAGLSLVLGTTRPDGVIFAAAYPLTVLISRTVPKTANDTTASAPAGWRVVSTRLAIYLVGFCVPALVLLLIRHAVFGLWVPNTAVAKAQGGASPEVLQRINDLGVAAGPGVWAFGAVCTLGIVARSARHLRSDSDQQHRVLSINATVMIPITVCFGLAAAAFIVLRRDWMLEYRFATPAVVCGSMLLAALAAISVSQLDRQCVQRIWRKVTIAAVCVLLVVVMSMNTATRVSTFAKAPTIPGCFDAERYGKTFNFYADRLKIANGSLLLPEIGGALLTSRLRVYDLAGLTEPTIGRLRGQHNLSGIRDYVLNDLRPTFVNVHLGWDAGLTRDRRFRSAYLPIVPGSDYVRRDATNKRAVRDLQPDALSLVRRANHQRGTDPLKSCGVMRAGQLS